jgi:hypothetical protein
MSDLLRVTDETTRDELASALANVCARARRIPHVVGSETLPSEWDRRHATLNELLTEYFAISE